MNKIISILKLIRIHNCLMASAGTWLGGYLSGHSLGNLNLVLASIATALVCGAGNALNDFFDYESDKINHPNRPLPSGNLPIYMAVLVTAVMSISAIAIALFVNIYVFGIVLLALLSLFAYDGGLKKTMLTGNVIVALLGGLTLATGALVEDPGAVLIIPGVIIPAGFATLFHLSREIIKDIADSGGDRRHGVKSLPLVYSERTALAVASVLFAALIALTTLPLYYEWYNIYYLIIAFGMVDLPLFAVLFYLWKSDSERKYRISGGIIKLLMFIGLLAFFFGRRI